MSQTGGHAPRGTASMPNSNCHDDCSTGMLPSPELAESNADNASGNNISEQPTTFRKLPQELRNMIWKESLLDNDIYYKFSGCNVNPDQAFPRFPEMRRQPSQHGPILLYSRAPTIAHLCQDARVAALEHHNQDWARSGLPASQEGQNNSPWLSKSTLLVPKSHNQLGYGVLPEELQREPFKTHSLLLDTAMILNASTHLSADGLQHHHHTSTYHCLRYARDDQVMVTIPDLGVDATFTFSQWSQWKILACQVPGCNDDQIFAQLLDPEDLDFGSFVYRDVYVDAQDHNALWCILRAARGYFPPAWHLLYLVSLHDNIESTLRCFQELWVQQSRELSGEEKAMPRVKPVIKIRIKIELD